MQLPTKARTCCLRCRHVLAGTGFESHLVRLRNGREYDVVPLAGKRVQIGEPEGGMWGRSPEHEKPFARWR